MRAVFLDGSLRGARNLGLSNAPWNAPRLHPVEWLSEGRIPVAYAHRLPDRRQNSRRAWNPQSLRHRPRHLELRGEGPCAANSRPHFIVRDVYWAGRGSQLPACIRRWPSWSQAQQGVATGPSTPGRTVGTCWCRDCAFAIALFRWRGAFVVGGCMVSLAGLGCGCIRSRRTFFGIAARKSASSRADPQEVCNTIPWLTLSAAARRGIRLRQNCSEIRCGGLRLSGCPAISRSNSSFTLGKSSLAEHGGLMRPAASAVYTRIILPPCGMRGRSVPAARGLLGAPSCGAGIVCRPTPTTSGWWSPPHQLVGTGRRGE